jgi:proteasome lid subunit RPN8/RPN11
MPERSGEDDGLQAIQEGQQERHAQEEEAWQERAAAVGAEQQVEEDAEQEEEVELEDISVLQLPQAVVDDITADAKDHGVSEICGFICLEWKDKLTVKWRVLRMTNTAAEKLEFAMDPEETIERFEQYGDSIVGVYHSHPQGSHRPSQNDVDYAPIGLRYWIVTQDQVIEWDMCNDGIPNKVNTQTRTT